MKQTPTPRAEALLSAEGRDTVRALGLALRAARTSKGITRKALAGRLLIGTQTLHRMEAGDPRVSLGYYYAAAGQLGVPMLDTARLLGLTSSLRHATSRARPKSADMDRFR